MYSQSIIDQPRQVNLLEHAGDAAQGLLPRDDIFNVLDTALQTFDFVDQLAVLGSPMLREHLQEGRHLSPRRVTCEVSAEAACVRHQESHNLRQIPDWRIS